ncbi:hypothetical protein GGTG_06498 [Gaeumannomyces tritici R3-111a-1]|uniref:Heterokaryon incompatibility domain-containing protein n=1 Tax=Gaeumannomyces tritici (strain R3-111a-1) TaxID=644352 RepID=J3NYZ7_GAET3|nr:hypothetical protein GGTG_06498 [Gaeumannomyces tritici R3-111a-1]EJT76580.1 hypothetical protein GGTG_06498 [Gaeumannomyces tritici R3-111a-1]
MSTAAPLVSWLGSASARAGGLGVWAKLSEAYIKILYRPWWQRVWVLQELLLAKKVTPLYGPHSIDWELFRMCLFRTISLLKHFVFFSSRDPHTRINRMSRLLNTLV